MNKKTSADTSITRLIEGYKKFRAKYFENSSLYEELVAFGQTPKVLVIACCDSRVDPALVTRANPGELFVVRNVANLVPPFDKDPRHHGTSAAVEFAVKVLGVTDIIVFGHSHCGGIQALMQTKEERLPTDFIASWMNIATKAKAKVLENHSHLSSAEQTELCEKKSLQISLDNLKTFPWIAERMKENALHIHGWYFNLGTGEIEVFHAEGEKFIPLDA